MTTSNAPRKAPAKTTRPPAVEIPADSNALVEQTVTVAAELCRNVPRIDWTQLDRNQLGTWTRALGESLQTLNALHARMARG